MLALRCGCHAVPSPLRLHCFVGAVFLAATDVIAAAFWVIGETGAFLYHF